LLISHRHRFIFIHVPKNAGLSITAALEPFADKPERTQLRRFLSLLPVKEDPKKAFFRWHTTALQLKRKLPAEVFDGYLKFAVVRNPYDRAVSYYHYLVQNAEHHRHEKIRGMTFRDYLEYDAERIARGRSQTQLSCVADEDGRILVDRILHFESIGPEFAALCRELGLPADALPTVNASKKPEDLSPYADDEARALVERLYSEDFGAFGYPMRQGAP
jgi:hypothetical protein